MEKLLIIESPNKVKTLQKYLPKDFEIISTVGHIRDLSKGDYKNRFGFDADFEPQWSVVKTTFNGKSTSKKALITQLKAKAKKAKEIYLATDPDREGEAIAWHVFDLFDAKTQQKCKRITFNEITQKAVLQSFEQKRDIDMNWVHSQFTRRMLDRLVGFQLSQLVQKKVASAKSAGRVQTVALDLIDEREQKIANFISQKWWAIDVEYDNKIPIYLQSLPADYKQIPTYQPSMSGYDLNFQQEVDAQNVFAKLDSSFQITAIAKPTTTTRNPKPPYKTASLQQDAINKLHWTSKKITLVAQNLYEGVNVGDEAIALITYPRTDSIRLANEFVLHCQNFISKQYGQEYVNQNYQNSSTKGKTNQNNVQDAHEAIRPVDMHITPASLQNKISSDQLALYTLIYNRTLAALMSKAQFQTQAYTLNNNGFTFTMKAKTLLFAGYKKVDVTEEEETDGSSLVSQQISWQVNDVIHATKMGVKMHQTNPPARFNQASLIAELEKSGIGRPSTYSTIANIVLERGYVDTLNKLFVINAVGKAVINHLKTFFPDIINKDFTRQMEEHLDAIANGKIFWKTWLKTFADQFQTAFANAQAQISNAEPTKVGKDCPLCQGALIIRKANKSKKPFVGCSNYPNCKYLEPIVNPTEKVAHTCPMCAHDLLVRKSHKSQKPFIGCSNFPQCKYLLNMPVYQDYVQVFGSDKLPAISGGELKSYIAAHKDKTSAQNLAN